MLEKLLTKSYTIATLWFVFLVNGFALFNFGAYPSLKNFVHGAELPEELLGASWDYQSNFLQTIGEQGVAMYTNFQYLDFVNAILLGLTLAATLYFGLKAVEAPGWLLFLCIVPLLGGAVDVVENVVMLVNLSGYPPELGRGLAGAYSWISICKFVLVSISFLLLLITIVVFVMNFVKKRFLKT